MGRRFGLTVALPLLSSATALAGSGPYVGFHGGRSGVDVSLGSGDLRLESTDFAWKGFLGVGLGRFLYYDASDIGKPWMASLGLTIGF
ncbi:MAG: hypothetical protein PVJ73_07035 [Acidobacteriota bacterium]|jgi:hypothetical protein